MIRSQNQIKIESNSSTMSDLVFLLLIFFMITSTLISPNAVPLSLPQSTNENRAKSNVTVYIVNNEDIQKQAGIGSYEIVVANILAEVLTSITPVVPLMLKEGGIYITSGILNEKENIVIEAMEKAGLTVLDVSRQGEWSSVMARK